MDHLEIPRKKKFKVRPDLQDSITDQFVSFSRFIVLQPEDVQKIRFGGYVTKISRENESAAWKHINNLAQTTLKKYPTSIQEDNMILKRNEQNPTLTTNQKNCILYRKSEKVVL